MNEGHEAHYQITDGDEEGAGGEYGGRSTNTEDGSGAYFDLYLKNPDRRLKLEASSAVEAKRWIDALELASVVASGGLIGWEQPADAELGDDEEDGGSSEDGGGLEQAVLLLRQESSLAETLEGRGGGGEGGRPESKLRHRATLSGIKSDDAMSDFAQQYFTVACSKRPPARPFSLSGDHPSLVQPPIKPSSTPPLLSVEPDSDPHQDETPPPAKVVNFALKGTSACSAADVGDRAGGAGEEGGKGEGGDGIANGEDGAGGTDAKDDMDGAPLETKRETEGEGGEEDEEEEEEEEGGEKEERDEKGAGDRETCGVGVDGRLTHGACEAVDTPTSGADNVDEGVSGAAGVAAGGAVLSDGGGLLGLATAAVATVVSAGTGTGGLGKGREGDNTGKTAPLDPCGVANGVAEIGEQKEGHDTVAVAVAVGGDVDAAAAAAAAAAVATAAAGITKEDGHSGEDIALRQDEAPIEGAAEQEAAEQEAAWAAMLSQGGTFFVRTGKKKSFPKQPVLVWLDIEVSGRSL